MKKAARTLNNIGSYIGIVSILFLMTISVILIGIKRLVDSSLATFNQAGTWISERINPSLETVTQTGIYLFIFCSILLTIVIIELVFINSEGKLIKLIGNICCLVTGITLVWIGAIPFIISMTNDESAVIVTGLLFVYTGISGILLTSGSILYIIVWIFSKRKIKKDSNANKPSIVANK